MTPRDELRQALSRHDFHVHTSWSPCAHEKDLDVAKLARRAGEVGLRSIAITDHFHEARPGFEPPPFYAGVDQRAFESVVAQAKALDTGVEVLAGCEIDMVSPGVFTVSEEFAWRLPVALVAASHYHLKGMPSPADASPRGRAQFVLERMKAAINWPPAQILAHPLICIGKSMPLGGFNEVVDAIRDEELAEVLGLARERGVAIELNAGVFTSPNWSPEGQVRFYTLAKRAGCRISPGGDAHSLDRLGAAVRCLDWAARCGIEAADIIDSAWLRQKRGV